MARSAWPSGQLGWATLRGHRGNAVRALGIAAVLWMAFSPLAARSEPAGDDGSSRPRPAVLARGLAAYHRVEQAGLVRNELLTIIDYALPSSQRRLWVIDPASQRVLRREYVAHGRGSSPEGDPDHAVRFGNDEGSHRSSLGTFLTGTVYPGEHGLSLELVGLDSGLNDHAVLRRIVMHPAAYASADFRAKSGGRLGRSWGCPALDPAVARSLIDRIEDGSVVFADFGQGG